MGDANNPVNIWMWKAGWRQAADGDRQDVNTVHPSMHVDKYFETRALYRTAEAAEISRLVPRFCRPSGRQRTRFRHVQVATGLGQNVGGKGIWRDGFWNVILTRELKSRDADDVKFDIANRSSCLRRVGRPAT
jgi:hypothetical protein